MKMIKCDMCGKIVPEKESITLAYNLIRQRERDLPIYPEGNKIDLCPVCEKEFLKSYRTYKENTNETNKDETKNETAS